jgi:serine/threonine protein kinase
MGEVYLATDTELDRTVALKILPTQLASDQQRMRRFVQEAKAASGLNHQNIITIYDIGQANSTRYIATEFVDGLTLRQRMKQGALAVSEALEVATQIASALSAAHDAGIVHRDIKPENIMIRSRDGFVKVLDFGLVKLTENQAATTDTEAPTRALVNTDAGTVMGTVAYMSPEQARGKTVDARSDIWSLGVILYEMVAGYAPFGGETSADIIAAIVKTEPPSLSRAAPDLPVRLEEIITKALEKDRDDRYQTIKDLLVDLRRLKKRIDFEAEMHRSLPAEANAQSASARTSSAMIQPNSQTIMVEPARPTSSAEYIVSEIKRHKIGVALVTAVVVLTILGGAFGVYKLTTREQPSAAFQTIKITRLTTGGKIGNANIVGAVSISPDGKYVVFETQEGPKSSLWLRQIATNSLQQIVPPIDSEIGGTTFSPDGEYVYYVVRDQSNNQGVLYQVATLGGNARKLLTGASGPVTFSPDGKQIAFVNKREHEDMLLIANADGTGEPRKLIARQQPEYFSFEGPSWSPDGRMIACSAGSRGQGARDSSVMAVSVSDGKPHVITDKLHDPARVLWLADGKGLIVAAFEQLSSIGTQLWHVSYPEGEVRRITNDLNGYGTISLGLTRDSKTIVTVQEDWSTQLWSAAVRDKGGSARQITQGKYDGWGYDAWGGVAYIPDGRIIYGAVTGEQFDLWIMNADSSGQKQLTADQYLEGGPAVSPDGRYIVFDSNRAGKRNIWRMDLDGGNLNQLTFGEYTDRSPVFSRDGQWIFFDSVRSGERAIWRMPVAGGEPVKLAGRKGARPSVSPDGQWLAYFSTDVSDQVNLNVVSVTGEGPMQRFALPPTAKFFGTFAIQWTPDSRSLCYADNPAVNVSQIICQPREGGNPSRLVEFNSGGIFYFALSPDQKQVLVSRSFVSDDVVLIRDAK